MSLFCPHSFHCFSKTRLEDYYFGFEIATVVEDNGFDGGLTTFQQT